MKLAHSPSKNKIASYIGKRSEFVDYLLCDIEPLGNGKAIRYFIGDVADKIIEKGLDSII